LRKERLLIGLVVLATMAGVVAQQSWFLLTIKAIWSPRLGRGFVKLNRKNRQILAGLLSFPRQIEQWTSSSLLAFVLSCGTTLALMGRRSFPRGG
jgi:hypothetical protein